MREPVSDYERRKQQNIRRNEVILSAVMNEVSICYTCTVLSNVLCILDYCLCNSYEVHVPNWGDSPHAMYKCNFNTLSD